MTSTALTFNYIVLTHTCLIKALDVKMICNSGVTSELRHHDNHDSDVNRSINHNEVYLTAI